MGEADSGAANTTAARADPAYGWVLVAILGMTETVSWGVLYYAFAVFLLPMRAELGLSAAGAAGAFSLALAVSGVVGLFVGRWLDSHGPRALMTGGSVLATLLVLAWSQIHSLVELYAVFAGIGAVMAVVLYEPAFIVITKWFAVRRHQALTTLTLIAALASFIFSPLSEHLISSLGWRQALIVLALVLAAVTIPLHGLGLRSSPRRHPQVAQAAAAHGAATGESRSLPGIWLLTASFVLLTLVSSAVSVLLVTVLVSEGHTAAFAAGAAGLIGLFQIPGRLLFTGLNRWIGGWRPPVIVFGAGSLAIVLLALNRSVPAVLTFAAIYGMSNGVITLMRASLVADLYGRARYGRISSTPAAFVSAARAVAPFAAACAALLPGGYRTLLWMFAAASAGATLTAGKAVAEATARRMVDSDVGVPNA